MTKHPKDKEVVSRSDGRQVIQDYRERRLPREATTE
jgi:hypothetical protein